MGPENGLTWGHSKRCGIGYAVGCRQEERGKVIVIFECEVVGTHNIRGGLGFDSHQLEEIAVKSGQC